MEEAKKTPVWVWVIAMVPVVMVVLGVLSAFAIYGVRKYIVDAKQQEARAALVAWGDGLARCSELPAGPPPSTKPIPAALADVSGKKYMSAPAEWSETAHTCAGFSMTSPQYFQYTWQLESPSSGVVQAMADLDADGLVDVSMKLDVTCSGGRCERGAPVALRTSDSSGEAAPAAESVRVEAAASGQPPVPDIPKPGPGFFALAGLCMLGLLGSVIWRCVQAFQVSVGWGFLVLCVPVAPLVFLIKYWERAKRPFFLMLASWAVMVVGGLLWVKFAKRDAHAAPVVAEAQAPSPVERLQPPPLPPSPVPADALRGEPIDLSTVMGRARKLANEWQPEAALLGIEAQPIVRSMIQTQEGGAAKLTFGPSSFHAAQPRTGVFIVTYDKSGIRGAPAAGAAGKALPEPMCAPEFIYRRVAGEGQSPAMTLRYAFTANQRPAWLASLASEPKALPSAFDPQDCQPTANSIRP